jgi:hypothetical protein
MSDDNNLEEIPFKDLPHHLALEMLKYGVTLLGVDRSAGKVDHQGSGTFVKSGDRHYILTAGHCARDIQYYPEMGLAISGNRQGTTHPIPKPINVAPIRVTGPDMAFMPLTEDIVEYITQNSDKEFYDLDRHRDNLLKDDPKIRFGLWVIVGAPLLMVGVEGGSRSIRLMGYSAWVDESFVEDDFDYIEVRAHRSQLPTFQGMSGGGLWQVELGRKEDQSIVFASEPRLEGCGFVERSQDDDEFIHFRCHSRNSIYQVGLNELRSGQT